MSAVPSLGVVAVRRQGSVSLCTQAAGCDAERGAGCGTRAKVHALLPARLPRNGEGDVRPGVPKF